MQCTFQSIIDSLITVDPTSLDQHKQYCTIALSLCEIYDDLMVLMLLSGSFGLAVHKYLTG